MSASIFQKIKDTLNETASSNSKADFSIANRVLFSTLNELCSVVKNGNEVNSLRDENVAILEELTVGKKVPLSRSLQALVLSVYKQVIDQCPGYIVRNILNSMVNISNNKNSSPYGRECAINLLSYILLHRVNDCASQIADVYQTIMKLLKATEFYVRLAVVKCLNSILIADNGKMIDILVEMSKTSVKLLIDKSNDVKIAAMGLIETIIKYSLGFSILSADNLLPGLIKCLDDENNTLVQDMAARVIATIYHTQILTYTEKQELSKIGAARGGSDNTSTSSNTSIGGQNNKSVSTGVRLSMVKLPLSLKKTVIEEVHDYHAIVENIIKLFFKMNTIPMTTNTTNSTANNITNGCRVGYLFVLGYLLQYQYLLLSNDEINWTLATYLMILQDNTILAVYSYEEQNILRLKLSYILRHYVYAQCNENQLLYLLIQYIQLCQDNPNPTTPTNNTTNNTNNTTNNTTNGIRNELEIQFILIEILHLLSLLSSDSISILDDILIYVTMYLRHMHYTIRILAANVIVTICQISHSYVSYFLSNALIQIHSQIHALTQFDTLPTLSTTNTNTNMMINMKENEKLQRIYCFHGYILVISSLCQHLSSITNSNSLSSSMIQEIITLGITLMSYDITLPSLSTSQRTIYCTFNRAGGLLIASFCTMEYSVIQSHLPTIITLCTTIIQTLASSTTTSSDSNSNGNNNIEEGLLFEMMTMETIYIVLLSLLQSHLSTIISYHIEYMTTNIIYIIEEGYQLVKNKYSPYYANNKQHGYHIKILQILILQLYHMIPSGLYPTTTTNTNANSTIIYVDMLKILRDGITNSQEGTFGKLLPLCEDYLLSTTTNNTNNTTNNNKTTSYAWLLPLQFPILHYNNHNSNNHHEIDHYCIYQIELYMNILSRKENESFLTMIYHNIPHDIPSSNTKNTPYATYWTNHHAYHQGLSSQSSLSSQWSLTQYSKEDEYRHIGNTYQNNSIDIRIIDIAILVLAKTFSQQSSEYQDKAIQLFTQALQQILSTTSSTTNSNGTSGSGGRLSLTSASKGNTSSNSMSSLLFSSSSSSSSSSMISEEEKKRKEKKNTIILKNIVLAIHAIVIQFPIHSGQYYDLDYNWRQTLVDMLYSILNYSSSSGATTASSSTTQFLTYTGINPMNTIASNDFIIRRLAAQTLYTFATKWKGCTVMNHIASRIRTNIIMSFEKKSTIIDSMMNDYTGYVIMLGYLWIGSDYLSEIQSLVQTTLFDCLRRTDSSIYFQSHVFSAFHMIVNWFLHHHYTTISTTDNTQSDAIITTEEASSVIVNTETIEDFFEKLIYVIEFSLMHLMIGEDLLLYVTSLLQLMNASLAVGLLYHISITKYLKRLFQLWQLLLQLNHTYNNHSIVHEMRMKILVFQGIGMMITYDQEKILLVELLHQFEQEIGFYPTNEHDHEEENCWKLYKYNPGVILEVTNILYLLAKQSIEIVMQRGYLVCYYILFDITYQHLAQSTFSENLPGLEIKFDQIGNEYDYSIIYLTHERVKESIEQVITNDLQCYPVSNRLLFWLLIQRNIALGVKQQSSHNSSIGGTSGGDGIARDEFDDDDREEGVSSSVSSSKPVAPTTASNKQTKSNPEVNKFTLHTTKEFITQYRDLITRHTPQCPATYTTSLRLPLKIFALQIIYSLMKQHFQQDIHLHTQIAEATSQLNIRITQQIQHVWTEDEVLTTVPISFGWFFNEWVNFTCSMTIFTINDYTILSLQGYGIALLAMIVQVYQDCEDPESVLALQDASNPLERRILNQYLSQVLSAIRIALSGGNGAPSANEKTHSSAASHQVTHLPPFTLQSIRVLLITLIQSTFIQDKVMLKRMLKPILSFADNTFSMNQIPSSSDNMNLIPSRFAGNKDIDEYTNIQEQCLYMNLISQLLFPWDELICDKIIGAGSSSSCSILSVRENKPYAPLYSILVTSFQSHLGYIEHYGKYVFIDTCKWLAYHPEQETFRQRSVLPSSIRTIIPATKNAQNKAHYTIWEQYAKELHPLRGGNTYHATWFNYPQLVSLLPIYLETSYYYLLHQMKGTKNTVSAKEVYMFILLWLQRLDTSHTFNLFTICQACSDKVEEERGSKINEEVKEQLGHYWELVLQLYLQAVKTFYLTNRVTSIAWQDWVYMLHIIHLHHHHDRDSSKWTKKHYLLLSQIITILTSSSSLSTLLQASVSTPNAQESTQRDACFTAILTCSEVISFLFKELLPSLFITTKSNNNDDDEDEQVIKQWRTVGAAEELPAYVEAILSLTNASSPDSNNLEDRYHVLAIQQTIHNIVQLQQLLTLLTDTQQQQSAASSLVASQVVPQLQSQYTTLLTTFALLQSVINSGIKSVAVGQHVVVQHSKGLWELLVEQSVMIYNHSTTNNDEIMKLFVWLWQVHSLSLTSNMTTLQVSMPWLVDTTLEVYTHLVVHIPHLQTSPSPSIALQDGSVLTISKLLSSVLLVYYQYSSSNSTVASSPAMITVYLTLVQIILKYIQSSPVASISALLQSILLPVLLLNNPSDALTMPSNVLTMHVKALILFYTMFQTQATTNNTNGGVEKLSTFLSLALRWMIATVTRYQQVYPDYLAVSGKALNHIARTTPDFLKAHLMQCSDNQRQALQLAMKTAMLQEQQQQQQFQQTAAAGSGVAGGSSGGIGMKISLDKYKK